MKFNDCNIDICHVCKRKLDNINCNDKRRCIENIDDHLFEYDKIEQSHMYIKIKNPNEKKYLYMNTYGLYLYIESWQYDDFL